MIKYIFLLFLLLTYPGYGQSVLTIVGPNTNLQAGSSAYDAGLLTNMQSASITGVFLYVTNGTVLGLTNANQIIVCEPGSASLCIITNNTTNLLFTVENDSYTNNVSITNSSTGTSQVWNIPGVGTVTNNIILGPRNSTSNMWTGHL
jgi:hypothetical protein